MQVSEQVRNHDSMSVRVVHDTVTIVVHDTVTVEVQQSTKTDEGTLIEFGAGGGQYNSKTGEASNVKSVKEQKKSERDTNIRMEWSHAEEQYKATIDSLGTTIHDLQMQLEEKQNTADIRPKTSGWHRFLVWWFWCCVAAIVLAAGWWAFKKFYLRR